MRQTPQAHTSTGFIQSRDVKRDVLHCAFGSQSQAGSLSFAIQMLLGGPMQFDTFRKHVVATSYHVHGPTYPGQHATQNKDVCSLAMPLHQHSDTLTSN
jgi:hypothetical protein